MSTKFFSITEMAQMHNISRQTLIYYDKIGLFKPENIDTKSAYRYYSAHQIPILREICFQKSIGVKLDDIKRHLKDRNLDTAISLLEQQKKTVSDEINNLIKMQMHIEQKLELYKNVNTYSNQLYIPNIKEFSEREVIFVPFQDELCKATLYITYTHAWERLLKKGIIPSKEFGTIIMRERIYTEDIFKGAGGFVCLPYRQSDISTKMILPAGTYACMYKYEMPYEIEYTYPLLEWVKTNGYIINGNIIDACVLDRTFNMKGEHKNLSELQIPIILEKNT